MSSDGTSLQQCRIIGEKLLLGLLYSGDSRILQNKYMRVLEEHRAFSVSMQSF